MTEVGETRRIYLDSNVFIYALDGPPKIAAQLRELFAIFIWSRIFDLRPVGRDILIETANYRKVAGMPKLPDAVHVVTAIQSECLRILSADLRLKVPAGYSVIHPDSHSLSTLIQEFS